MAMTFRYNTKDNLSEVLLYYHSLSSLLLGMDRRGLFLSWSVATRETKGKEYDFVGA